MSDKTVSDCYNEMYVMHLYVIVMRVPIMYWSGIILYLGQLTGYSEWASKALDLFGDLIKNFKNGTQKEQIMVLPMGEMQKNKLLKFAEREIPGAVSVYTMDEYYYENTGKSFSEALDELYYEEETGEPLVRKD